MVSGALQHAGQDKLDGLDSLPGLASQDDGDVVDHDNLPDYLHHFKRDFNQLFQIRGGCQGMEIKESLGTPVGSGHSL